MLVSSIIDDGGATAALIEAEGVRYEFLETDITAPGAPRQVVDACVERLGSLDILINSAGIWRRSWTLAGPSGTRRSPST